MLRIRNVNCLIVATIIMVSGCATGTKTSLHGNSRHSGAYATNTYHEGMLSEDNLNANETSSNNYLAEQQQAAANFSAKRIALLLPQSGKLKDSADAVRAGFMAASYEASRRSGSQSGSQPQSGNQPRITVYDTNGDANVSGAMQKALDDGADFIVGPLSKPGVAQLQNSSDANIPVLSLNYTDSGSGRDQYFQFGLAPEDEARQAAQQAWKSGRVNAMIIAQNSAWGARVADAFSRQWQSQGGNIRTNAKINPKANLAEQVAKLLEVDTSQFRANQMKREDKTKTSTEPKRRQDIDLIFLAAYPVEARQIKPLLAFYYAGDLPVYATSSVYGGAPNQAADRDLNGVIFCDSPAILSGNRAAAGTDVAPEEAGNKARLYALGVDAYNLMPQLSGLEHNREMHFNGASGQLALTNNGQIMRQLPCAQFKNGLPTPL